MKISPLILAAAALVAASLGPAPTQAQTQPVAAEPVAAPAPSGRKAQVVALLKALETGATGALGVIDAKTYIQHNLAIPDGPQGLRGAVEGAAKGATRVRTLRVFEDGDFVFSHSEYEFFGHKMVGFDIFRFEGGKIVEHWDNLQAAAGPNPSGRSMVDGPSQPSELGRTEDNKQRVAAFVRDVLVEVRSEALAAYFDGERYIQHNPYAPDGVSGLRNALQGPAGQDRAWRYERIRRVLGEGDFVLVVSEGVVAGKPAAFYDLFRTEKGKIAEHWDAVEIIAARSEWKNPNGKF